MSNELPPCGRWAGYYLYGHGGSRHRMKLTLVFAGSGAIDGGGVDDVAAFVITGRFDVPTGQLAGRRRTSGCIGSSIQGCIAKTQSVATGR
jgi:hypothetical protein